MYSRTPCGASSSGTAAARAAADHSLPTSHALRLGEECRHHDDAPFCRLLEGLDARERVWRCGGPTTTALNKQCGAKTENKFLSRAQPTSSQLTIQRLLAPDTWRAPADVTSRCGQRRCHSRVVCVRVRALTVLMQKKPLCQRHFSERHFQKTVKPGGPGKRDASLTCYLLLTPPGRNGNAARTAAGSRPETTHAATTSAPPTTHCGSSPSPRSSSPKALAQSGSVATMTDAADCGTCASVRGRGWRGSRCGEGAGGWEGRPATAAVWQRCGGGRGKEPPPASALSSRRPARGRW